jgi:catechol 2,3-dioxygenase-like lactoylglutathione lyase family enzyme
VGVIRTSTAVLAVANVPRAIDFYREKLGFRQNWVWGEPPTFGCVGLGSVEIFLCEQPELAARVEGHQHMFFVHDVEALHAQHAAAGAPIISPPENKPWGMREYTVRDISGYHLRFGGPQKYERPPTARQSLPPDVRIEVALPSVEQYVSLLRSVNWEINEQMAREVLGRTTICILARDHEDAVGLARVTGDGRNFTIWDVVVRPDRQSQRIGSAMVEAAIAEIRRTSPHAKFVGLFTGKPTFYERLGFKTDGGMHLTL